jgi:hypothetical protein
MNVTMMLCDSAVVAENKLFILGGGWSVTGPDPRPMSVAIKLELEASYDEREVHWELFLENHESLQVMLQTPAGLQAVEAMGNVVLPARDLALDARPFDVCLAINFPPLELNHGQDYQWKLSVDGEIVDGASVAFSIAVPSGGAFGAGLVG